MATKKVAPKKAAKAATPAKKAVAKNSVSQKSSKAGKVKADTKKSDKKAAPAKQPAVSGKVIKPVASTEKESKAAAKSSAPAKKAVVAEKPETGNKVSAAAKHASEKPVTTEKKGVVEATTVQDVKPAIKPLEKPAPKTEATKKPVVVPKTSTSKAVKYEPEFTKSVLDFNNQNPEQQRPTMRYSDAELTEFRELINRKLDTAKKELAYLQGLITRKDESGEMDEGRYMTMEDGSMSMEREQLSQMASRQIQFIDHLEKAIMRIENKTYGVCRVTGKLIDKARLRAVPHATLSIEAKQMMNK